MGNIYIVSAKRTPQGAFLGSLVKHSAVDLAMVAGRAALEKVDADKIDQVIVGNVLSAGLGMNIARQIGVGLGVPIDRIAYSVNMMCASGMQAIILAVQTIRAGDAETILCGGTESMSRAPFVLDRARSGYKLGDGKLIDVILKDGLTDSFSNTHMGLTAETLAEEFGISRTRQDEFAAQSQQKYGKAFEANAFADEIVVMEELDHDEHPRAGTTVETLAKLKAVFKRDGTVTAGNASGINDGASMLVVCSEKAMQENGWFPLAVISGCASVGCEPARMGLGPVHATEKLCEKYGMDVNDFDAIELNEAFASQSIACIEKLGLDVSKVNPNGGAIALGHPIGASGARIVTHLANRIARGEITNGLATLCVGGGMGSAMAIEAVS
jgi:acetyl-CoA C-acetyltransferase